MPTADCVDVLQVSLKRADQDREIEPVGRRLPEGSFSRGVVGAASQHFATRGIAFILDGARAQHGKRLLKDCEQPDLAVGVAVAGFDALARSANDAMAKAAFRQAATDWLNLAVLIRSLQTDLKDINDNRR
jgi:hypothetical protein